MIIYYLVVLGCNCFIRFCKLAGTVVEDGDEDADLPPLMLLVFRFSDWFSC